MVNAFCLFALHKVIFQTHPSFRTDTHSSRTPCVRVVRVNRDTSLSSNSANDCVKPFFFGRPGDFLPLRLFPASLSGLWQASPERRLFSIIVPLSGVVLSFCASNSWPNMLQASLSCILFLPLPRPLWYFLSSFVLFFTFKISSTISLFARPFNFLLSMSVTFFSCRSSGLLDSKRLTQLAFIPVKTKRNDIDDKFEGWRKNMSSRTVCITKNWMLVIVLKKHIIYF